LGTPPTAQCSAGTSRITTRIDSRGAPIDCSTASVTDASFTPINFVHLNAGDTIDFQVGCGANADFFSDTTGLNAIVEQK